MIEKLKNPETLWTIALWAGGSGTALVLGVIVSFMIYAPRVVDQFNAVITASSNNTLIFDANENLVATVEGNENRHAVLIDQIHPFLQKGVVAIEDRRFFSHRGMDPIRLMGALWADIKALSYEQGASTITQQLVKLTLLSSERTLNRKIKEIFMALALERSFPKLKLLELYLNRVYLGNGVYGVEKASRAYFQKSAAELTLQEAAFLAALIKKPEGYLQFPEEELFASQPFIPLDKLTTLKNRQQLVIRTMANLGWITPDELKVGLSRPLVIHRPSHETTDAAYFVQQVLKELRENLGVQRVSGRGYRVYTTLNPHQQATAEKLVGEIGRDNPENRQASLISMDPLTGEVRALVGGVDYRVSQFNRATQARRQPGSAIKPILYAAALEDKFRTNSVFVDEPVRYAWDEGGFYTRLFQRDFQYDFASGLSESEENAVYAPRNYNDSYGLLRLHPGNYVYDDRRMTLARALELSSNVIAVQLLDKMGMDAMVRLGNRLNLKIRKEMGLCIALGCSEVTLVGLTSAYASFANGGFLVKPVYILKVANSDGDVIYEHFPDPPEEVISSWTAFQIRQLLSGVLARGTGVRAHLGRPAGGKTGTNDGPRDTWFVGFTPTLVTGVWLGSDGNEVLPHEAGGRTTATLWRRFMTQVLPPYGVQAFPKPREEYVRVEICNIDGQLAYDDCPDRSLQFFRESEFTLDLFAGTQPGNFSRADPGSAPASLPRRGRREGNAASSGRSSTVPGEAPLTPFN